MNKLLLLIEKIILREKKQCENCEHYRKKWVRAQQELEALRGYVKDVE